MSNFQCESCGAVYIDNGITGYETKQCKTTADVIKGLNEKIVLLQNMNKSLKYTCLFGGGAIRGVSYIGAIKALEELGISPTTFGKR